MNPEAVEYLNKILQKNPSSLSQPEIIFLKARRTYLKDSQLKEYAEILESEPVVEEEKPQTDVNQEMIDSYKEEAKGLGLEFSDNVTKDELISMIKAKKSSNRVQVDTKE